MSIWSRRATKQTTVLAATRRDGAIWAHLFVGSPRNIDILLRALLLDLHPTSPPSHTCLYMKQVLVQTKAPRGREVRGALELLKADDLPASLSDGSGV